MSEFFYNRKKNEITNSKIKATSITLTKNVNLSTGAGEYNYSNYPSLDTSIDLIAELSIKAKFISDCYSEDSLKYADAIATVDLTERKNTKLAALFKQ